MKWDFAFILLMAFNISWPDHLRYLHLSLEFRESHQKQWLERNLWLDRPGCQQTFLVDQKNHLMSLRCSPKWTYSFSRAKLVPLSRRNLSIVWYNLDFLSGVYCHSRSCSESISSIHTFCKLISLSFGTFPKGNISQHRL